MKKKNLTEGVVDKIYKLLSIGKYSQVQKNFKNNREVQNAIKKAEQSRKDLVKTINKFQKSHGTQLQKINKTLQKQKELKNAIAKENQREFEVTSSIATLNKKIADAYKKGSPELRKQLTAAGGINDQFDQINLMAKKTKQDRCTCKSRQGCNPCKRQWWDCS